MAKKVITPDKAVEQWKEMTLRASLSTYYHVNGILVGLNIDNHGIVVIPDESLLKLIITDSTIKEFDLLDTSTRSLSKYFKYGMTLKNTTWESLVEDDLLRTGKLVEINIADREFPILITKELLPLKLKKAEFTNVGYTILVGMILAIRKRFQLLEDYGFSIIRMLSIL